LFPKKITKQLKNYSVLYVEDDKIIRDNITEILNELFFCVESVCCVSEALLKYEEKKFDLIISDIRLKNENGLDFIKKIRENDKKTRIIITSAFTDLDYLLIATELHLVKYIVKPITQENLSEAFDIFLNSFDKNKIYKLSNHCSYYVKDLTIKNNNEDFILTKKEACFLNLLLEKNRIITYKELEYIYWGKKGNMTKNAMRLFIKNFRKKLPKDSLKNIQDVGYKLDYFS